MTNADIWVSVSTPYIRPHAADTKDAWAVEAAEQGHAGTHVIREVAEVTPPADVAQALNLGPGETAVVRRRTMLLDGAPVELTDSYYPVAIARGTALSDSRKVRGGAVTLLAELGYLPQQASEDVCARVPTDDERQLLQLGDHDWVLDLRRVLKTSDGSPVEVSVMAMIAHGRHLRYDLSI